MPLDPLTIGRLVLNSLPRALPEPLDLHPRAPAMALRALHGFACGLERAFGNLGRAKFSRGRLAASDRVPEAPAPHWITPASIAGIPACGSFVGLNASTP